jgi:hypothetical protein
VRVASDLFLEQDDRLSAAVGEKKWPEDYFRPE